MIDGSHQAGADEQDASMDTILASIRRIIMEDEAGPSPAVAHPPHEEAEDDLLVLQPSMIVEKEVAMAEPAAHPAPAHTTLGTQSAADLAAALFDDPEPIAIAPAAPVVAAPVFVAPVPPPAPAPVAVPAAVRPGPVFRPVEEPPGEPLLAPSASLAATQALASLQEAMRPEPPPPSGPRLLRSGGPTLEDLVRDELRGQLKDWLDSNLPPLVERLVAQEIGRLVGRG